MINILAIVTTRTELQTISHECKRVLLWSAIYI